VTEVWQIASLPSLRLVKKTGHDRSRETFATTSHYPSETILKGTFGNEFPARSTGSTLGRRGSHQDEQATHVER
jgi:hypothetical protein